jgi:hypothetical protein
MALSDRVLQVVQLRDVLNHRRSANSGAARLDRRRRRHRYRHLAMLLSRLNLPLSCRPYLPTRTVIHHLLACRLDTARPGPLRSAYICLPTMSFANNEAIPTLPFIPANLLNHHVQLRREERHPACSGHLLLPSRLYRRRFLSNWSWLQPQALVRHHRHHILRA